MSRQYIQAISASIGVNFSKNINVINDDKYYGDQYDKVVSVWIIHIME